MSRWRSRFEVLSLFVVFVIIWEIVVRFLEVPSYIIPAPSLILSRLADLFQSGLIWPHLITTGLTILSGLALGIVAGLAFGALIGVVPPAERLIYPYLVAMQTVPKIAIAPLFVLWFGYGITSKIVISALISFFPVLVSVISGLRAAERDQMDMMRVFGASRWQSFLHLRLYAALPTIFAGIEIASILAVIGAIVGEFVGAQEGLGYLITTLNFNMDVAGVFATLIILSAIGLSVHALARYLGRRMVFWRRADEKSAVLSH
ncbi:ABC transporter permease [Telmatospirillum sp. J64-1]|uniref:ABC transporter permease n=1 Tax=Telmatospirillum sp. J64-1 TaxID=2502183 RepID=UPI00115CAC0E|nr:ABC transporter permease [Telmatospirillum sp. J64-1]